MAADIAGRPGANVRRIPCAGVDAGSDGVWKLVAEIQELLKGAHRAESSASLCVRRVLSTPPAVRDELAQVPSPVEFAQPKTA
jgi:hypothetical protein